MARINRKVRWLCYFGSGDDARAFADEPELQKAELQILAPSEDIEEWAVHIYGPWRYDDTPGVLEPLSEKHHGEFDGRMETPFGDAGIPSWMLPG